MVAESVVVEHSTADLESFPQRAQNLRASDRFVAGWCSLFVPPARLIRHAIVLQSSTLLNLHRAPKKARVRHSIIKTRAKAQPLSTPSSAIPRGAARESPGQWVWLSVFALIEALFDESRPTITDLTQAAVYPGSSEGQSLEYRFVSLRIDDFADSLDPGPYADCSVTPRIIFKVFP